MTKRPTYPTSKRLVSRLSSIQISYLTLTLGVSRCIHSPCLTLLIDSTNYSSRVLTK